MYYICGKESTVIFSKKINIVCIIFLIGFLTVCGFMIVQINISYPKAGVISNDQDNSIMWNGCKVKAVSKTIYKPEDFMTAYPDIPFYKYLLSGNFDNTYTRIVLFKVKVTNTTDSAINFSLTNYTVAEAFPSAWNNGLPPIVDNKKLQPGESSDFEVASLIADSLVSVAHLKTIENDEFHLVFSYYPDKVYLKFD